MNTLSHLSSLGEILLFFAIGIVMLGYLRKSVVDSLKNACDAYKEEVAVLRAQAKHNSAEIAALRAQVVHLQADGEFKTKQLGVTLRILEHFERVITVVLKNRRAIAAAAMQQIDDELLTLARFRQEAALDLESMDFNTKYYDHLLARAAILGPEATDKEP